MHERMLKNVWAGAHRKKLFDYWLYNIQNSVIRKQNKARIYNNKENAVIVLLLSQGVEINFPKSYIGEESFTYVIH